jgi:hypothetical protein
MDRPVIRHCEVRSRGNPVAPLDCFATLAMTPMRLTLILAFSFAFAGCTLVQQSSGMLPRQTANWREIVTADDRTRLRDWRDTFVKALTAARNSGHAAEITREGPLLEPDAAIGGTPIPNGTYRCRTIKLGAKDTGLLDYVAYPAFTCQIRPEDGLQRFTKLGGSQRLVGIIFSDDALRQVLLGTLVLGDEPRALPYSQDEMRDVAAFVERIGPNRWRLVMPQPHFESQLDVMELVPLPSGAR